MNRYIHRYETVTSRAGARRTSPVPSLNGLDLQMFKTWPLPLKDVAR